MIDEPDGWWEDRNQDGEPHLHSEDDDWDEYVPSDEEMEYFLRQLLSKSARSVME